MPNPPSSLPRPPVSPRQTCHGAVYFPRLLDKIRLHAAGQLAPDYLENLGKGMDLWTCQYWEVGYDQLQAWVADGLDDETIVARVFERGRPATAFSLMVFNEFLSKRGFRDALTDRLAFRKEEAKITDRDDIQTFFDYIDFDEGRS